MELYGEGNYAIGDVKDITITNAFQNLDEKTTKCQTNNNIEDCVTKTVLEELKKKCECSPFHLQNFSRNDEVFAVSNDKQINRVLHR